METLCYNTLDIIIEFIDNKTLYNLANNYKINGHKSVTRLIKYCFSDVNEHLFNWGYSGYDTIKQLQKMVNLDNIQNMKIIINHADIRLKWFPENIRQNKELVLEFIKKDPYNLRYAHIKFLDDKDVILLVEQTYGYIVKHMSERLSDDDDIFDIAVKKNNWAIFFASERIKKKYTELIHHLKYNRNNENILCTVPLRDNYFLNEELKDDKYIRMRKLYNDNIEFEKKELEIYNRNRKKERDRIEIMDIEYRKKHFLPENTRIYRDEDGYVDMNKPHVMYCYSRYNIN